MAQSSQSTPTVPTNIGGTVHNVNLRDYLNIRVAPFLKKAITESLDAAPDFPLQWLGENLIHQSMLYENNPDSTSIRERFLYKFETPTAAPARTAVEPEVSIQEHATIVDMEASTAPTPVVDSAIETSAEHDTQMSTLVNGESEPIPNEQHNATLDNGTRDTEMEGTS